jgi:hypothetical protein
LFIFLHAKNLIMNAIVDLSAEAVSYITLIQDLTRRRTEQKISHINADEKIITLTNQESSPCQERISELVWSSRGELPADKMNIWLSELATDLLQWLSIHVGNRVDDFFAVPFAWREQIHDRLYADPESRWSLAAAIRYMPLQVIQATSGTSLSPYRVRLYQVLQTEGSVTLFNAADATISATFWAQYRVTAQELLADDEKLRAALLDKGVALPFETFFGSELDEVSRLRNLRGQPIEASLLKDPYRRAESMDLAGLALSGGGIRSATFNLGVLQRLANLGVLRDFDYLSTVSGGGYIGSWLTNWIRHSGSVDKVSKRLCPISSPVPLAEEVRPLRWLRMYSNYLAPNSSLMSADTWTIGTTWLRNTLINQFILLLLLVSVLSCIDLLFHGWIKLKSIDLSVHIWVYSTVIFGGAAFLAGRGMRSYDRTHPPQSRRNGAHSSSAAVWLVIWSFIAACYMTTWCYRQNVPGIEFYLQTLWPCIFTASACMVGVSFYGRYHRCRPDGMHPVFFYLLTITYSLLAGVVLWFLLSCCGAVVFWLKHSGTWETQHLFEQNFEDKLVVICSPVLFLEAACIAVVIRMALFGRIFPDERREWWGRVGALVHRQLLTWVVVCTCALLVPKVFMVIIPHYRLGHYLPTLFGGWATIVGLGVKFAFDSGDTTESARGNKIKAVLISVAPYLFMLGFLLIGANALSATVALADQITWLNIHPLCCDIVVTVALTLLTLFLSNRVGVNEFSLHHFYRNRLVRAYLGATRRRTDRERTANSFTGFDSKDDFLLASLAVPDNNYNGPYPLINTALNASTVTDLDRQDRKAESFLFSPLYCGFDFSPVRSAAYSRDHIFDYAYRPTHLFSKTGGPSMGTAIAISGAAVNPNQGFHSNSAMAFLLTLFNVRLGWWLGNPRGIDWQRSDPRTGIGYLIKDVAGRSDVSSDYVSLSDGGHFDNMGLYELVRRRCSYIVLCDAEEDHSGLCAGLANAIRRCYIDFGAVIDLDITPILNKDPQSGYASRHTVTGTIHYPGHKHATGKIIYVKASLTSDTAADIREYARNNPAFPHQSTGDQFFDEAQFESYRKLGYHSITLDDLKRTMPKTSARKPRKTSK